MKTILIHLMSAAILVLGVAACSKPSAESVCQKFEAEGFAKKCRSKEPGGLGSAAAEAYDFDLPHGKTGQVLRFETAGEFEAAEKAFEAASMFAGRHRYGKKSALIFVQLNSDTDKDVAKKAKEIVDSL